MEHPCKCCTGEVCCRGKEKYCDDNECCDLFMCLCSGTLVSEAEGE